MYIDHCSNPTRGDSLPHIPNEIYLKIFSYVAPSDDGPSERESQLICSALTKVCRLFYAELLPRVFESVEFTFSPAGSPHWPKSITFCKELNKDREPLRSLAPYIRTCTVGDTPYPGRIPRRSACTKIYAQAILRLVNLESLSLFSVHIDAKIFRALEVVKSLKKLWISECRFKADEIPLTMQPLNLSHFGISDTYSVPEVLFDAVSSPSLRVLEVDGDDASYALYFIRKPIKWHLEQLSFSSSVIEHTDFATFLHKTPSIRTLSIGTDIRTPPYISVLSRLPSSSLPKLECLKCYPILLPQLIRTGRAVNHLQVFSEWFLRSCNPPLGPLEMAALKQSSAYLETLRIPLSYMTKLVDGGHFPYLRTLIIEYDAAPGSISDPTECLIPMAPRLPILKDLTLRNSLPSSREFDLPYQHSVIIADIVPKVPEITSVALVPLDGVCWRRNRTDQWYPIVPLKSRKDVRSRLSHLPGVVDFGGLFASLFRLEELLDSLR